MKEGISLVALVITIIVLIILTSAVIMNITGEDSIITKASEATSNNNIAVLEEKITMKSNDYMLKGKPSINIETREILKQTVLQSGVDLDKLLVYYGNDKQYVCYKIDKVTEAEEDWFSSNTVTVGETSISICFLFGDANFDEEINDEDVTIIMKDITGTINLTEFQTTVLDLNHDDLIQAADASLLKSIMNGGTSYSDVSNR